MKQQGPAPRRPVESTTPGAPVQGNEKAASRGPTLPANNKRSTRRVLDCGGKRSATPLLHRSWLPPEPAPPDVPKRRRRCALPAHSKTSRWFALLLHFILNLQLSTAFAQSFAIDWHTIDGGGGTSTGGVFSIIGTIGQPDAGAMSGGQFILTGGFWALPLAVQSSNAPTLSITNAAPGWATVWWTPPAPGFVLQETLTLTPPAWSNAPSGATNPVTIPATLPLKFYRLFRP